MSAGFSFDGLAELKESLRTLPESLAAEGGNIVEAETNAAAVDIRSDPSYPLRETVEASTQKTARAAVGTVTNTSRLAYIFEEGTEARHYVTVNGKNHLTGKIPPGHKFVPKVMAARRKMYEALADLLRRNGLEVSGDNA